MKNKRSLWSFLVSMVVIVLFFSPLAHAISPELSIIEKRAREGSVVDMYLYGRSLVLGDMGLKDIQKGLGYLEKAASKDYPPAVLFLAQMYEKGLGGVERNYIKAFKWYERGKKLGLVVAKMKLRALENSNNSSGADKDSVVLFGLNLQDASRFIFRYVLQKSGANPVRMNDKDFCDIFDSQRLIPTTDRLQVCFDRGGRFVLLEYRYPPRKRKYPDILATMLSRLEKKYGSPKTVLRGGKVDEYVWHKGKIGIYFWLEPRTATAFLRYVCVPHYRELMEYLKEHNATRKKIPRIHFY